MILAYHRINPWYKKDALTVSPEMFRKQLSFLLDHGWQAITPEKILLEIINNGVAVRRLLGFSGKGPPIEKNRQGQHGKIFQD
ncbi:MAG: hypothetical protein NC911_10160, partial [Candidatus Omnitrophica bacterium]|nr:hypothetical protein [Candidatus Omnitrophota bacterium]